MEQSQQVTQNDQSVASSATGLAAILTMPSTGIPSALPPYSPKPADEMQEPPSYTVAVQLPSYEEYERIKRDEENAKLSSASAEAGHDPSMPLHFAPSTTIGISLAAVPSSGAVDSNEIVLDRRSVDRVVGTDGMFILGFVFAFLFNWLGLLIAFCLLHTCAGRFGALAGFGMSIIKWVAIAKRNNWASGTGVDDSWMWWMMMAFGLLISCSGFLQYIRVKYMWMRRRNTNTF